MVATCAIFICVAIPHSKVTLSVFHIRKKLSLCFCNTLLKRRLFHSLVQIFKILHNISPPYLFHLFHYAKDALTTHSS